MAQGQTGTESARRAGWGWLLRLSVAAALYAVPYTVVRWHLESEVLALVADLTPAKPPPDDIAPGQDAAPYLKAAADLWDGLVQSLPQEAGDPAVDDLRISAFEISRLRVDLGGVQKQLPEEGRNRPLGPCAWVRLSDAEEVDLDRLVASADPLWDVLALARRCTACSCIVTHARYETEEWSRLYNLTCIVSFAPTAFVVMARRGQVERAQEVFLALGDVHALVRQRGGAASLSQSEQILARWCLGVAPVLDSMESPSEAWARILQDLTTCPDLSTRWRHIWETSAAETLSRFGLDRAVGLPGSEGRPQMHGAPRLLLLPFVYSFLEALRCQRDQSRLPMHEWGHNNGVALRSEMWRRLTCWGIALRMHRLSSGAYPESLDALGAQWGLPPAVDIFTGKPLAYRREGEGFVLYSVGEDGEDDGGRNVDSGWHGSWPGDYVFRQTR